MRPDLVTIIAGLKRDQLVEAGRLWVAAVLELPAIHAEPVLDAMVRTLQATRPESVRCLSDWDPTEGPGAA